MNQLYHSWACTLRTLQSYRDAHASMFMATLFAGTRQWEQAWMTFNRRLGDEDVVHRHKGVLAVTKNEICREVSEAGK